MNPEDYEVEPTAPRITVRPGRDVQPGLPTGLHLFYQVFFILLFLALFGHVL